MRYCGEDTLNNDWDTFWTKSENSKNFWERFLRFYRVVIVGRTLNFYIQKNFASQGLFLEAGSGRSETTLCTEKKQRRFIAIDLSFVVLKQTKENPKLDACLNADIFCLPFKDNSFDGIWNVGVMEHFYPSDIDRLLAEFHRVLKPGGKLVLFWPMAYAPYEIFINAAEFVMNRILKRRFQFYPDEVSRLKSRRQGREFLSRNGYEDTRAFFNYRDFFSFGVVVGTKGLS